ncbi:MAG: hypothetical protein ACE5FA_13390 [Dehalococcoidia bacterium]
MTAANVITPILFACGIGTACAAQVVVEDDANLNVLASLSGDTVALVESDAGLLIRWTSTVDGRRRERWMSMSVHSGDPEVDLRYVNDDSLPDLFWTLRYEEIIGGMLLVAHADSALRVFVTGTEECSIPELVDLDSDGLLDVVRYTAGAITESECEGDALALMCQRQYTTDWATPLFQREGGFVEDVSAARSFYSARAAAHRASATRLSQALASGSVPSARCNETMLSDLRRMAERADSLAQ